MKSSKYVRVRHVCQMQA